jgi:Rrf2 family protein
MSGVVKFSEAASLALHTMGLLAAGPEPARTTHEMAERLDVSENHLAKVLQRLGKAGLVASARGPSGGFHLLRPPGEVTLLEVYEAIEGPLGVSACLFAAARCNGECILGGLLADVGEQIRSRLAATRLDQAGEAFGPRRAALTPAPAPRGRGERKRSTTARR